ncbi:G1/S-specific cyclin Pcl5 [Pochonia chlamydosporia 170]|uniref:G1/S-specific cyclin Pcl5 n=1 Tax=Pochonia chlamydosporia 170 TaxID=1380566 RepID=A0A179FSF2_METCM|nr:G1/S-specific cyclin Pcl5 [Pochonia chlamydosporia 170]OAQ68566.1 G1/S-specific cyclin Pcl5 [Pochonia chlamydosporia 170]
MKYDADDSPAFVASSSRYAPYSSAISSAASTSTASVWSDTASQSSDDTSISANTSDSDSCDAYCLSKRATTTAQNVVNYRRSLHQRDVEAAVPAELRQNPRRSAPGSHAGRGGCPPTLVRQSDRKVNFVDSLVGRLQQSLLDSLTQCLAFYFADSSTQIVEAIWPLSSVVCRSELGSKAVLPLRTFIQETLRRSRTSYSTLQVALYYLVLIKPHVPKHNFTTEQPDDRHADRALQCGRRMFLAALILASKYLQDRNYSARAWSKISGLNTQEINQNEIAFLLAVNWKLHITDEVFQRWTEIVLKYTPPPSPPSPGAASQAYAQQSADWKQLILKLEPELANIDGLIPGTTLASATASDLCALSPRSILNLPQESRNPAAFESLGTTPTPKMYAAPSVMEPAPSSVYTPGRLAPAMTLLPTPRLTPQTSGFCTPAVSAASQVLGKSNAMGLAMAQASSISAVQTTLDRFPCSVTSSPQGYCPVRRSSLANSVSTASSPESMVSDSSRSSRSSSISSASSLASATLYNSTSRCSVPSRFRVAKLWNDRVSLKPSVPSVPEDYDEHCLSSSPESYTGEAAKLGDLCLDTPLARRERELDEMTRDPASDAARALQDLHNHDVSADATPTAKTGSKRSRASSIDNSLHENVRDILSRRYKSPESSWANNVVRSQGLASESYLQVPVHPTFGRNAKRVCCSAEAATGYQTAGVHPAISLRGPGMWDGILN